MSPTTPDNPSRISCLKPDEMDTASIITRKLTAMEAVTILLLKRRRLDMNNEASISLLCQLFEPCGCCKLFTFRTMLSKQLKVLLFQLHVILLSGKNDAVLDSSIVFRM